MLYVQLTEVKQSEQEDTDRQESNQERTITVTNKVEDYKFLHQSICIVFIILNRKCSSIKDSFTTLIAQKRYQF